MCDSGRSTPIISIGDKLINPSPYGFNLPIYQDSLLKVGWVYPQYSDFWPWHKITPSRRTTSRWPVGKGGDDPPFAERSWWTLPWGLVLFPLPCRLVRALSMYQPIVCLGLIGGIGFRGWGCVMGNFLEIIPIHVCYNIYQKSKIPYMDPLGNGWFVMETTMNINHSCR